MKLAIHGTFFLPLVLALAGCAAGQSLQTTYTPPAPAASAEAKASVLVAVADDRLYVKNGDKPPHYIGKYRAGFGNPWNVYTQNDEPADHKLSLSIKEWNFDGYQNGKMWYEFEVTVHDVTGKVIVTDTVREETAIKGTFWMGAKGGFEREMPKLYTTAVAKVVRENPAISAALGGTSN